MLESLSLWGLGYSWGGFESLVIPSDPQISARNAKLNYPGPLIRLHVGLECVDDLLSDLRHGLDQLQVNSGTSYQKIRATA